MSIPQKHINRPIRVLVAMSGGVDSSVAALLLREAGCDVIGVTMDTGYGHAPEQAAAICAQLGLAHHVVDVRQRFATVVVDAFVSAYLAGETPNPCVNCNAALKFSAFAPLFARLEADFFATGHYIRINEQDGRFLLFCGDDMAKDQSYFLYRLRQETLRRCLFPLGGYTKARVRELAARAGLASAIQKDSYDICFIENGDYRALLRERAAARLQPGEIVDMTGLVVGHHDGLANYTIGQRRGLALALGYPAYVVSLDMARNRLVVGARDALLTRRAYTADNHFIAFAQLEQALPVQVKIRYKAAAVPALIRPAPARQGIVEILFNEPVWGVTPGQSAVFYDDDLLVGGGRLLAGPAYSSQ